MMGSLKISSSIFFALLPFLSFGHIGLSNPTGGESYMPGQTVVIEWYIAIAHATLDWDLYFSPDGGNTWSVIEEDVSVEILTYSWEVPDISTQEARIRVVQDNVGTDYDAISDNFSIGMASVLSLVSEAKDTTIDCGPNQDVVIQSWLGNHGGATISGTCESISWSDNYDGLISDCGFSGSSEVSFLVSDTCGNTLTTNATITVVDQIPPTIDIEASNLEVSCDGSGNLDDLNTWLFSQGGAVASDNCGPITWSNDFSGFVENCDTITEILVNFSVADDCGNSSETSATFIISPTTGLQTTQNQIHVNIYPVPANRILNLKFEPADQQERQVQIFGIDGKSVFEVESQKSSLSLHLDGALHGVYLLRIISDGHVFTKLIPIESGQ